MDAKILAESGWKTISTKFKVKDNGLQRALATLAKLDETKFDEVIKCLGSVSQLASALKKSKEVSGIADVVKYLTQMIAAADAQEAEAVKAKALAAKTAAAAQKKADDESKSKDKGGASGAGGASAAGGKEDEDEEKEDGDVITKLTNALKTIKTAKDPYFCLICDAKPFGLIISKKDIRKSAQARKELSQLAGGSTRPPRIGTCRWDSSKLVFDIEKPPSGLARIFQKWIKENTGLAIKVMVGTESGEDDEKADSAPQPASGKSPEAGAAGAGGAAAASGGAGAGAASGAGVSQAGGSEGAKDAKKDASSNDTKALEERRKAFKKARAEWIAVKTKAEADLEKVKDGAKMQYMTDAAQFPKIVKGCKDIDAILDHLDDELRNTLDQYASTPLSNAAKLKTLSATASAVLDRYYKFVESNALMKAIDKKEFADVTVHAPIMKALGDLRKALS